MAEILVFFIGTPLDLGVVTFNAYESHIRNGVYQIASVTLLNAVGCNRVAIGNTIQRFREYVASSGGATVPDGVTLSIDSSSGKISLASNSSVVGFHQSYLPILSLVVWNE